MKQLQTLKHFIIKYKHGVILSYFFIYLAWFTYLERTITTTFTPVYSKLDDLIPFNEIFIIPYYLWFIYIAATVIYFLLTTKQEFYRLCANLFIGMTICLTIYTIWPNGHYLRVNLDTLGRSNVFIDMLSAIYNFDTATNVFPSIHVFNSVAAMIAISKSERLHQIKWLQWSTLLLTILISLSTVFLKQHSVMDIFGALGLNTVMYLLVYLPSRAKQTKTANQELSKV